MRGLTSRRREPSRAESQVKTGTLRLEWSRDGRLIASIDGTEHAVTVSRCFPWSDPMAFLSLRDTEDAEVALVADPLSLDAASRVALESALADASFVFGVRAVIDLDEEVELRTWHVSTEQGERRFQTRLDDWPRKLPDGGLLVRDVTGDLYRIGDVGGLDRKSRERLWAFVD